VLLALALLAARTQTGAYGCLFADYRQVTLPLQKLHQARNRTARPLRVTRR
jgi:hypothetical protein